MLPRVKLRSTGGHAASVSTPRISLSLSVQRSVPPSLTTVFVTDISSPTTLTGVGNRKGSPTTLWTSA